jgi:beta-xylosidase
VWAPDIAFVDGRFAIYYTSNHRNKVVCADSINGPWNVPVELNVPERFRALGDPGHVQDSDGKRYLFFSGGFIAQLTPDGTEIAGEITQVYNGWPIPVEWRIEGVAEEGPKLYRRGDFWYLLTAQGGTAGPATSHMAVIARSRSLHGPWENSPYNPLIRTWSHNERWISRGHTSLIDGPHGKTWAVSHAYDNHYWTLGRHTVIEPISWTDDDWPALDQHVADSAHVVTVPDLSDSFTSSKLGWQWRFFGELDYSRYHVGNGTLHIAAKGTFPGVNSSPLCVIPRDESYEIEMDVEISSDQTEAGLVLFYNDQFQAGIGLDHTGIRLHHHTHAYTVHHVDARRARLRIHNDHQELDFYWRLPGGPWVKVRESFECSGWQHNTLGGFLSLRAGVFVTGDSGEGIFRQFVYEGLE